ncbi:phosphatidylinositol phosphate binding [Mactra antiquata]
MIHLPQMFQMMATGLDICVCNPLTGTFTTYEILIQTDNPAFTLCRSRTRRRYNDFCWLKKILKRHHPMSICPELPEKKNFSGRFEIQFLVQRMKELEDWLFSVVSTSLYLSDTTLHMFLQTSLSCKQIEQYLNGNLSESDVQIAYKNAEVHSGYIHRELECSGFYDDHPGNPPSNESEPIRIRTPVTSDSSRADSGIVDNDTDGESSFDSSGSSYVHSVESGILPDTCRYPPLTEVKFTSEDDSKQSYTKKFQENTVQTTININPNVKLHSLGSDEISENVYNTASDSSVKTDVVEDSKEKIVDKPVTHKVEMGVIFTVNS